MIALDSNLFIYFLSAHPEFGEQARELFVAIEQTSLNACASEFVQYEVLSFRELSDIDAQETAKVLGDLGITYKPITVEILQLAAKLRRDHDCGAMDSIHLASALRAKVTHFVTNDKAVLCKTIPGITLVPLAQAQNLY